MPGKSQYQAMRYSGRFQLERSAAEQLWIQAEIPMLFSLSRGIWCVWSGPTGAATGAIG